MTISRRGFIGGLAAGAGALTGSGVLSGTAHAAPHKEFPGYPDRFGLLHDTTLCVGCRDCEAGCYKVNEEDLAPVETPPDLSVLDEKRRTAEDAYTVVNRYREADGIKPPVYRKLQCMHCNEPCCASVCFVKALKKTPEGPVLYDPDVCVGCRYCIMVCPYDALAYEYDEPKTPRVMRCTMCYPRIKEGLDPGCSEACTMGAITFGKRADLIKLARERIRKRPEAYIDHIYGEYEFGGTSWLILSGIPFGEMELHEGATHTPIPQMGSGFLSVVPLVITILPGLFAGFYAFSERREKISEQEKEAAVAEALAKSGEEKENS